MHLTKVIYLIFLICQSIYVKKAANSTNFVSTGVRWKEKTGKKGLSNSIMKKLMHPNSIIKIKRLSGIDEPQNCRADFLKA